MPIEPNIALGVRPMEVPNPLAQYGQIAAIQNAQNQNALAQFQLGSARRQEETQNALSQAYQQSINPETGQLDPKMLISNVAKSPAAHLLPDIQSKLLESQTKEATLKKTTQETEAGQFKLAQEKLKHGWMSMGEASTPQAAIEKLNDGVKRGYFDFATASREAQLLQNMTPEQYQQYRIKKVMGLLDAKDQLGAMLPKVVRQDIGGSIVSIQDNPMLAGYGLPIPKMGITKTATIADNLAAAKFAFEKANPNQTIHEDASGLLAVNNRTGVATPVVYGPMGIQPAPAAGTSIMRQQGAGMPGARTPAVPGMLSVLDQTGAPAAMPVPAESGARVPGAPVGGKERNLPEHFVKTDIQLSGLAGSLKQFKDEIKANPTTSAKWLPTGADTARMQAKYTSLLMGLKDLYTLGALTGPDMAIIESQITNPASWSGKFTTKKGFEEQVQVVEDMLKRSATNLENSYGKTPKATKAALQALPGGVGGGGGIPNATATNPLGLAIPGVQ